MRRRLPAMVEGLLWTSPWWVGFLLFLALPMGVSFYISLCDYSLLQPPVFIGADNYTGLAADTTFHTVLGNTLLYAALAIPLGTVLAVFLAILLNQRVWGQTLFRACIFVPTIVPLVGVGVVWMWLLNPKLGLVNAPFRWIASVSPQWLADAIGYGPHWLDSPQWAMAALVLVTLWLVGSPVVIYLAGLQEIPETLYEAARIDGASTVRRLWHVTLPGLSPVILFNVVIGLITAWQVFALPYVMWRTTPGPEQSTYFYTMYLFDNAFRFLEMGKANAMAWIQFLIILALTGLIFLISRRTVHYRGA